MEVTSFKENQRINQLIWYIKIVTVSIKARKVVVKGPRGSLTKDFTHVNMEISKKNAKVVSVVVFHGARKHVACIRTVCSHIMNMIKGVTKGRFFNFNSIKN